MNQDFSAKEPSLGYYYQGGSAYKVMLMSASAFNLKKWLKNVIKDSKNVLKRILFEITGIFRRHMTGNLIFRIFSYMSLCGGCQYVR